MKDTQYFDYIKSEILSHYFSGYILEQDQLDIGSNQAEIEQLKQRIKQDYEKRKFILHRNYHIGDQS